MGRARPGGVAPVDDRAGRADPDAATAAAGGVPLTRSAVARPAALAGALIAAALLPLALGSYQIHVLTVACYYVILASSWNLIAGYTGLFSLAHHTFAGIGAYTSALLVIRTGAPIPVGVVCGGALACAAGYGLGTVTLRMRMLYLALATWAFAESVRVVVSMEYGITRGDLGLAVPKLLGTSSPVPYYEAFLACAAATVAALALLLRSRVGYRLRAIRDDEGVARAAGVNTVRWKRFAFGVSSGIAGLAGALYGHYIGLLSPVAMQFDEMALIIIMVILGGQRTLSGPVLGAVVVEVASEALRAYGQMRMVVFALVVVAVMRLYPPGLVGLGRALWARATAVRPGSAG
ncbi:MAG TPA: branched-chain amino acid ABC transporter permease [bacterium]|nr:branched-chain amino acid ABC transporter permease [bacterium]